MRNSRHICPDLFVLFVSSGAYLEYGEQYLKPEQLDEVDNERYSGRGCDLIGGLETGRVHITLATRAR